MPDEEAPAAPLYPSVPDEFACRICLESDQTPDDPLIAPCRCAGTTKWVHRGCLDEWRAQNQIPLAFTHCPNCKFQCKPACHTSRRSAPQPRPARPRLSACNWRVSDRTEISEEHLRTRRVKLVLFVARDTIGLFMALQGFLALAAYLLHLCDPSGAIAKLYPEKWAEVAAASHLKIGPYYVTTAVAFLALLGLVGLILYCTNNLPGQRPAARHRPRWRRPRGGDPCDNGCPSCDGVNCYYIQCGQPCDCPDCSCGNCECPNCGGGGGGCDGEGAQVVVVVALVLLVVFVVIGLVVGVFFSVVVVQRLVQRHVERLHLRGEAQVHRVLDLAERPELLADGAYGAPPPPPAAVAAGAARAPKAGASSSDEVAALRMARED